MKHILEVRLLGTPSLLLDDVPVTFPYRQAEALVYYLLLKKKAACASLADLFWGECGSEERARSNLRNAFYIIRKQLGKEFLQEQQNGVIVLGQEYELHLDVDSFLSGSALDLYRGDFLSGFFLRDNADFNDWLDDMRRHLCGCYVERLQQAIAQSFAQGSYTKCEALCARLREADELDEVSYRFSMELCFQRGQYAQALQIFEQLRKLLSDELSVRPSRALCELAARLGTAREQELAALLEKKRAHRGEVSPGELFYGRRQEIELAALQVERFLMGQEKRHVLLLGEAGIGKTALAEQILEHSAGENGLLRANAACYHAEEQYLLKPWQNALRHLTASLAQQEATEHGTALLHSIGAIFPFLRGDSSTLTAHDDDITAMDWNGVRGLLVNILSDFSRAQPLLFFFDDIQWMDEISLSLVRGLITSGGNILFVLAARTGINAAGESLVQDMQRLGLLEVVQLERFSYADTVRLTELLLPDYPFTDAIRRALFRETEGNAFFITELANHIKYNGSLGDITPNMRGILGQRIAPLSDAHRQVLGLLAVFFDGAPFDILTELYDKDEDSLLELLEGLIAQRLVCEAADLDDTFFTFAHQKLQEYVYQEMTHTRRRLLHNRVGHCYERRLSGTSADIPLFTTLIHHFERGANRSGYLKYAVRYLSVHLNAAHEFFPTMEGDTLPGMSRGGGGVLGGLSAELGALERLLHMVEERMEQSASQERWNADDTGLLEEFLHMTGRHYIRNSSYEKGLSYIFRLKELAEQMPPELKRRSIISANRQLICVYINRYELFHIDAVVAESLALLQDPGGAESGECAVWKRLCGLGCIMAGRLTEGQKALWEAIAVFESEPVRTKYLYNLAASYAWLGEAERHEAHYGAARGHYAHAIDLCNSSFTAGGVCIFYTYDGMALLDSGDFSAAGERLRLAVECYERVNLMWGRGLANCYYAQFALHEGRYEDAQRLLKDAWSFAVRLESNYEKGVIHRVYAQLRAGFDQLPELRTCFEELLPEPAKFYAERARYFLAQAYSPVDEKYLHLVEA